MMSVLLFCRSFNLELSTNCESDYVEIRELDTLSLVDRFCGSSPRNNITLAKSMYVKFRSDSNTNRGTGFMAQYSICKFV